VPNTSDTHRPGHRGRALAVAAATTIAACGFGESGIAPPIDRFFFPASIAVDPTGDWLYVVNSNSDLRYNAGTVVAVDLRLAREDRARADWGPCPTSAYVPPLSGPSRLCCQDFIDQLEWGNQRGSPVAYAPHLRKAPLPGVPAKSVIYQFNKGDQSAPNPNTTAILRAGDLADRATFYRHDLAFAADPTIPINPHRFLLGQPASTTASARLLVAAITRAYQDQIATFFASDGTKIIHPQPAGLFETPIAGALPEGLNFITTRYRERC